MRGPNFSHNLLRANNPTLPDKEKFTSALQVIENMTDEEWVKEHDAQYKDQARLFLETRRPPRQISKIVT
jgi:hypothetical protein